MCYDEDKFEKSWNFIMTVVDRIENTDCKRFSYSWKYENQINYNFLYPSVEIVDSSCWIYFNCDLDPCMTICKIRKDFKQKNARLDATYLAIAEFIEWYNLRS